MMVENADGMEPSADPSEIYYLPGMGGRLDAGLGEELLRRGFALRGRETVGAFKRLRVTSRELVRIFLEQLWFEFVPVLHGLQWRFAAQD